MSSVLEKKYGEFHEPLAEILSRVGVEMQDVAVLIERLEPMLECEKVASSVDAMEHMKLLQGIDLAVQKARGLAEFVDAVSNDVDVDHLVDLTTALNLITLSDLKKKLSSETETTVSADEYEKASGDLDFF
ncbi:MAG: hypothetical protein JJ858_04755 [Rhizobiaceae bacterium]|nr:hypothetical protein [Rhizobiaceae bacterium]